MCLIPVGSGWNKSGSLTFAHMAIAHMAVARTDDSLRGLLRKRYFHKLNLFITS